jgi:hypothetical protein
MPASPEELIAINSLLIEREAEFARVHITESRINELLKADYPFEAPSVTLPSSIKKKANKPKKTKSKAVTVKPRRLNNSEVAYRITWIDKGQTTEQKATDLKHLTTLLQDSLPGMKLLELETIDLEDNNVETLFKATN